MPSRARLPHIVLALFATACVLTCQNYPFEIRATQRVQAHKVTQLVATRKATDILFVIDDSGSMLDARTELSNNIQTFIQTLAGSSFDFHVGIVTTDVECNVPERNCDTSNGGQTSEACCGLVAAAANAGHAMAQCVERDLDGDGKVDWSTCDGGRLRAPKGKPPFWSPPAPQDANQWAADFSGMILNLGCQGSSLEAGLEAARRAINCSVFGFDPNRPDICPSANMAALNANFVRPNADLVVVFVTDEDDCSFLDPSVYLRPADGSDPNAQAAHLCSPQECYAYYWSDPATNPGGQQPMPSLSCDHGNTQRAVNPPVPVDANSYIDALVTAKGGDVSKVRAAGILSATANTAAQLAYSATPCSGSALGASNLCGCWSANAVTGFSTNNFYCQLTSLLTNHIAAAPANQKTNECSYLGSGSSAPQPGCKGMPGTRYVKFLEGVAERREAAQAHTDTLASSICLQKYSDTMVDIVNNIILTSCFALGEAPKSAADIQVSLNGTALANVPTNSKNPGWSWVAGSTEICLEGGLRKNLGDQFDIFVVDDDTQSDAAH